MRVMKRDEVQVLELVQTLKAGGASSKTKGSAQLGASHVADKYVLWPMAEVVTWAAFCLGAVLMLVSESTADLRREILRNLAGLVKKLRDTANLKQ